MWRWSIVLVACSSPSAPPPSPQPLPPPPPIVADAGIDATMATVTKPDCQREPEPGGPPWVRSIARGKCIDAAQAVDGEWVTLTGNEVTKGKLVVELDKLTPQKCGYPNGLAVGRDGRMFVSCGYSLLAIDPSGKLLWQVWPAGDHGLTPALVDDAGIVYIGGQGDLYALGLDGKERWHVGTGTNRYTRELAVTPGGEIVFYTSMAERHSPTDRNGVRRYHIEMPPELFVVDRKGSIVSRKEWAYGSAWPAWRDVTGAGGGRI